MRTKRTVAVVSSTALAAGMAQGAIYHSNQNVVLACSANLPPNTPAPFDINGDLTDDFFLSFDGLGPANSQPGSHQAILSIDDELVQQHIHQRLIKFFGWYANTGGMFRRRLMLSVQRIAQRRAENIKRRTRRQLMNLDRQTCRMLAFSGDME